MVTNGIHNSAAATVSLTVAAGTPTANAQSTYAAFNTATSITLTGSDPNVPVLALTYTVTAGPAHGMLTGLNASTGVVTYTPTSGYSGTDSFQFTVTNTANLTSTVAMVLLTTATPGTPAANAQSTNVAFNAGTSITLTGSDPDVPALTLTFNMPSAPAHGTFGGFNSLTGAVTYTPNTGYQGPDSFIFTVSNGPNTSAPATVSLTVAVGAPTANAQTANIAHDTATALALAGSDPDVPALPLSYNYQQPLNGTVIGTAPNVTYTPNADFQGSDSFTFTVTNGTNISSAATVSLTVGAGTPTANAQATNAAFNTGTSILLTGSDPDVPVLDLTYMVTASPAHGTLTGSAPNLTYTPTNYYSGAESFQFTVTNSANLTSAAATVSLTVAANPPPVFTSSPTAVPNPATAGKAVQFTANAADTLAVHYAWDFGDGATACGATVSHVFSTDGNYSVTIIATGADNGATSATVMMQVNAAIGMAGAGGTLLPGETDSDGDGFSNAVEIAAGSSPSDPTSTPVTLGASSTLQTAQLILKPILKVTTAKHTLKLAGSIKIPKGFVPLNKSVIADIGGFIQKFTLTKNGSAKTGKDLFAVHLKLQKGTVVDQTSKFSITLNNVPASIVPTSEMLILVDGMIFTRH